MQRSTPGIADTPARPDSASLRLRDAGILLAWFAAYLAVGALVVTWQPASGSSVWYPPIAIGIGLLLRRGIHHLPFVFVADLLVSLHQFREGWGVAAIVASNTAIEVLAAALLLRVLRFDVRMRTGSDFLWLVFAAGGLATLVGAVLGSFLLATIHAGFVPTFDGSWLSWWIGDATGVIVVLPAILLLLDQRAPRRDQDVPGTADFLEQAALFAAAALLCAWIFGSNPTIQTPHFGLQMFAFLPVVWAAIRFDSRTTAIMIVCIDIGATGLTLLHGTVAEAAQTDLTHLQLFMVTLSLAGVPLSLTLEGLRSAREALRRQGIHLADQVRERTAELEATLVREKSANAAKSDFLANISHELRTPMHAIRSFAKLGMERGADAERDKLTGYFARIDTSSGRLLKLLNDLLDLSKLEAGQMEMHLEPLSLDHEIASAVEETEVLAKARGVTVDAPEGARRLTVNGDSGRLQQVLINVLSNAIKFSPHGERIEVLAHREEARQPTPIVVEVVDHGVGIPEGELDAVFDKFVQSSKTRSGAGGTGLGLAISREIIRAHGGTIHAEHTPGGGTRVVIRLPAP